MQLNKTQEEIVNSTANNIIVSAGAGSGKTRVLTERVKHLIETGVSPENIVCITFTNKAADEMKDRLSGVPTIGDTFIGTIHSFANKILKASGEHYELLTTEKEIEIIRYLIDKYAKHSTIEEYMEYIKAEHLVHIGAKNEDYLKDMFDSAFLYEIYVFYGHCTDKDYPENIYTVCKKWRVITFDELLVKCTKYFKSINAKIEYLLVDELQDIGMNEYNFIMALNADNNFFVGDDWQSIYAFKGGDVRIFLNLMNNSKWTSYYLNVNYRNATKILDFSKTIIRQANNVMNKDVVANRKEKGIVIVGPRGSLDKHLLQIKEDGNYKDWFILVRLNKDIYQISQSLDKYEIPFSTFKQGDTSTEEMDKIMAADSVKLLTVHASKGLENKNVLLYGNFPVRIPPYVKNTDERKVMYVGCTRAMDKLIVLN